MAKRVRVLDYHQPVDGEPLEFLKKSTVLLLVRRAQADWIVHNVLAKRREPRPEAHSMGGDGWDGIKPALAAKRYIPDKMPPREVPGVFFQPPQSDTWKIQHRTVVLM